MEHWKHKSWIWIFIGDYIWCVIASIWPEVACGKFPEIEELYSKSIKFVFLFVLIQLLNDNLFRKVFTNTYVRVFLDFTFEFIFVFWFFETGELLYKHYFYSFGTFFIFFIFSEGLVTQFPYFLEGLIFWEDLWLKIITRVAITYSFCAYLILYLDPDQFHGEIWGFKRTWLSIWLVMIVFFASNFQECSYIWKSKHKKD